VSEGWTISAFLKDPDPSLSPPRIPVSSGCVPVRKVLMPAWSRMRSEQERERTLDLKQTTAYRRDIFKAQYFVFFPKEISEYISSF
jgi:hypothetical protein